MKVKKPTLLIKLYTRSNGICGICKGSIEEEWKQYREYLRFIEIKRAKRLKQKGMKNRRPYKRTNINLDIDHIIPYSKTDTTDRWSDVDNLQLTHRTCNTKKGSVLSTPILD